MKKLIFLSFGALLFCSAKQTNDYPFEKWDKVTLEKANTAKGASYLLPEEQKVIYYINLVRQNPALFAKTYLAKYIDSAKTKKTSFVNSLQNDLTAKFKPVDVITPKQDLTEEAADHAKDMGKSGKIGHFNSDGKSYEFRMAKFKGVYSGTAEACQYGFADALSNVIALLIDEGNGAVEHRKTIMDKNIKYAGASIKQHKTQKWNCVIDYGK